ncbi:hypothetical protein ACFZAU_07245 [Streptomyces sp. NPDC008238]
MTCNLAIEHTARAARWLDILRRQFPELVRELVPGSPGSSAMSRDPLAPEALRSLAERDREDRADRAWVLGGGSAPLRLHVSDALRDITDGVVELEEAVRDRLGLGRARRAPVPERLGRIAGLLDRVAGHPVLAAHVLDECRRMARRCQSVLGGTEALVRVDGRCPWCDSVSLRALPARRAVLCVNPGCRCTDEVCGCADDPARRHTWAETAWGQLPLDPAAIAGLVDREAE